MKACALAVLSCLLVSSATGCGGGGGSTPDPQPSQTSISLQPSSATVAVLHDGTPAEVPVTVAAVNVAGAVTLAASGVPTGVAVAIQQPTATAAGKLTFSVTDPKTVRAAKYPVAIQGTSGLTTGQATVTLDVTAQAVVQSTTTNRAPAFMSTSFQVAEWSYNFLHDHPAALQPLADLAPQHIRLQILGNVMPQTSATTWDFAKMDALVQPVLAVGDKSPQLQIGQAPAFMYDAGGKFRDPTVKEFADFCAQLVRYYNKGGFTANGITYRSAANIPITWWGVYNEPNINNVTPDEYVRMYNAVVPAMLAVDPNIKLVAIELSDWGDEHKHFLPPLLAGATAQIDAFATHYYSTCNQKETDQQLMNNVAYFIDHVKYFRATVDANSAASGLPIWVTENNVNADWDNNGKSACNGTSPFVTDPRGSTAFFAGWRPYVYAALTKAGMAGLWHWSFTGGTQYGEIADSGGKQLSWWVDYYLTHLFAPSSMTTLAASSTESDRIETFAARGADGGTVIMVANRDVNQSTDNNGPGVAKTVVLDVSALGNYTSATLLAIDATTNLSTGPVPKALAPAPKLTLSLSGYGVQFITLQ